MVIKLLIFSIWGLVMTPLILFDQPVWFTVVTVVAVGLMLYMEGR